MEGVPVRFPLFSESQGSRREPEPVSPSDAFREPRRIFRLRPGDSFTDRTDPASGNGTPQPEKLAPATAQKADPAETAALRVRA